MRVETAKLWKKFIGGHTNISVYTVDPGAHAVAVELVPLLQDMGIFAGWFAEGWSARKAPDCSAAEGVPRALAPGTSLIVGSQTNFDRTQEILRDAVVSGVRTVFLFDHWKNFSEHFGSGPLPENIVVPDEIAKDMLLAEIGRQAKSRVQVLPHLAIEAAVDRVRGYGSPSGGIIAFLLDPTEQVDGLGYDWVSTLSAVADFAVGRRGTQVVVKAHPRQDLAAVKRNLESWNDRGIVYELFDGDAERLIARADEVWGMTTVALNIALAVGKPIRSLQIGRNEKGRRASNPHIEPYVVTEMPRAV